MAGVVCYQRDGSAAKACYGLVEGAWTDRTLIGLLGRLGRALQADLRRQLPTGVSTDLGRPAQDQWPPGR